MKKTILSLALAFLFITAVNAQDKTAIPAAATQENPNAPEFKFDVEEYNFGTIKQGEKISYDFKFSNAGKDALVITEAHGSCGCTVPQWPKEPVAKGSKQVIHVEFNSAGKQGMQDKTVTITSNAKGGQKVLHLKGNVEMPPATDAAPAAPAEKK
jgi:hypothetical protein